jgi:hypothetical protein
MAKQNLLQLAIAATIANTVKGRSGSGKNTYLDRFINCLLDENGQPTPPKDRKLVIAEISLEIALEQREDEIAAGTTTEQFMLTASADSPDDLIFREINKKVKNQVASAIANNTNPTSVSSNEKYMHVWQVVKTGSAVSLAPVS